MRRSPAAANDEGYESRIIVNARTQLRDLGIVSASSTTQGVTRSLEVNGNGH